MFCEEEPNFVMEIMASPSTSFHELHTLIHKTCGYEENGDHLFLICNEDWKVKEKIHLHDTASIGYDEDFFLMENSILEDFIEEEGQHMAYIYETSARKKFLIELVENIFGEMTESLRPPSKRHCAGTIRRNRLFTGCSSHCRHASKHRRAV